MTNIPNRIWCRWFDGKPLGPVILRDPKKNLFDYEKHCPAQLYIHIPDDEEGMERLIDTLELIIKSLDGVQPRLIDEDNAYKRSILRLGIETFLMDMIEGKYDE